MTLPAGNGSSPNSFDLRNKLRKNLVDLLVGLLAARWLQVTHEQPEPTEYEYSGDFERNRTMTAKLLQRHTEEEPEMYEPEELDDLFAACDAEAGTFVSSASLSLQVPIPFPQSFPC